MLKNLWQDMEICPATGCILGDFSNMWLQSANMGDFARWKLLKDPVFVPLNTLW
jgi:hypothetical protein